MSDIKEDFRNRYREIREEYRSDVDKQQPKWHWHLTDNPKFKHDSKKGPTDMQPPVGADKKYIHGRGVKVHGGRLQTAPAGVKSDYNTGTVAKNWSKSMPWKTHAVAMDVSDTKKKSFFRGDGDSTDDVETLHTNPEKAKVKKVYPIKKAMEIDKRYAAKRIAHAAYQKKLNRYPKLDPKKDVYE